MFSGEHGRYCEQLFLLRLADTAESNGIISPYRSHIRQIRQTVAANFPDHICRMHPLTNPLTTGPEVIYSTTHFLIIFAHFKRWIIGSQFFLSDQCHTADN